MSEKAPKQPYFLDILNNSSGQFRVMARMIDNADETMPAKHTKLELETPGLAKHVGSWLSVIQSYAVPIGQLFAEQATIGYDKGVLMTYDLLDRVASANGQKIINPRFDTDHVFDSEAPDLTGDNMLTMSMRGKYLPERFPAIYKSAMTMLGRIYSQPPSMIEDRMNGPAKQPDDIFIVHFVTGVAEVVLPLEKDAEFTQLEQSFNLE